VIAVAVVVPLVFIALILVLVIAAVCFYKRTWTLEERRNRQDLIEVFKMYKGSVLMSYLKEMQISKEQGDIH